MKSWVSELPRHDKKFLRYFFYLLSFCIRSARNYPICLLSGNRGMRPNSDLKISQFMRFFLLTRFCYNFDPCRLECGGLRTELVHLRHAA